MIQNPFAKPAADTGDPEAGEHPVIIPQISDAEADKIINALNEQFEEKVLKKLKKPPIADLTAAPAEAVEPDNLSVIGAGRRLEGADLQNYLATIKAERPNVPFADEDSGVDLGKLLSKQKNVSPREKN